MALESVIGAFSRLPAFARLVNTLPVPGESRTVTGLPGSGPAALVASLTTRLPGRFIVVAAAHVNDAERWLADLHTLIGTGG